MEKHQPKDASELKGKTGLRRLMNATKYSAQGFRGAWQTEEAVSYTHLTLPTIA